MTLALKHLSWLVLLALLPLPGRAQVPGDSLKPTRVRPARPGSRVWLFGGYTQADTARGRYLTLGPLVPNLLQFNTVEGLVLSESLDFNQRLAQNRQFLSLGGSARYGFGSRQGYAKGYISWLFNRRRGQLLRLEGGRYVEQFNDTEPVTPLLNTIATLVRGANFLKLYETQTLRLRYEQRLGRGLTLLPSLEAARRVALVNTTLYSFRREDRRDFTSNDPQNPDGNAPAFRPHDRLLATLAAQLDWGETFNRLSLSYQQALPDDGLSPDFARLRGQYQANRTHERNRGESRLSLAAGGFLAKKRAFFPDYFHFLGNETRALRTQPEAYALLPYHRYSTDRWFVQGYYERHFRWVVLPKGTIMGALGWGELAGLRLLLTPERGLYAEASYGLENVFKLYRFDLIAAFGDPYGAHLALRYGVDL